LERGACSGNGLNNECSILTLHLLYVPSRSTSHLLKAATSAGIQQRANSTWGQVTPIWPTKQSRHQMNQARDASETDVMHAYIPAFLPKRFQPHQKLIKMLRVPADCPE